MSFREKTVRAQLLVTLYIWARCVLIGHLVRYVGQIILLRRGF